MLLSYQNLPETPRALLHRSRDVLLEIKLTLKRVQNSTLQRRLYTDWLELETSQDALEPLEWLNQVEALRSEVSNLYVRQPLPTAL
jgi:hypothetical protein